MVVVIPFDLLYVIGPEKTGLIYTKFDLILSIEIVFCILHKFYHAYKSPYIGISITYIL